jgi:diadenosine tetraphosphate (Ap4A) HIT family hydrolase
MTCPFCRPAIEANETIILSNELCAFIPVPEPIPAGSGMIVPWAHRETVFDLTPAEWAATCDLLRQVKAHLDERYAPDGYNVGWNSGAAGGQHVFHAHMHVIPRYADEPLAGKGIRHWLKQELNRRPGIKGKDKG